MTQVINLFGGPGCGKSTTAAGLFYTMKKENYNVELVTEYVKEKVWENNLEVMKDQLYVLSKQNRRLERLIGKVDYVITDSPLLLGAYYGEKYGKYPEIVVPFIKNLFNKYSNINIFIHRTKVFSQAGRLGGLKEAIKADEAIKTLIEWDFIFSEDLETIPSLLDRIKFKEI